MNEYMRILIQEELVVVFVV